MLVKMNSMENVKPQGHGRANGISQLKYYMSQQGNKTLSSLRAGLGHICQVRSLCPRAVGADVGSSARSPGRQASALNLS